jgi:hypothetical protein
MKRALQDLSFTHSLSLDMGYLVPIGAIDVLPGDTFIGRCRALARLAPLAKPMMHPVDIRVHYWYVPNRIIWDDWEDFIVGNEGAVTYPTITPATAADAVLYDHMGAEPVAGVAYDALPLRAYSLIFNEFYRDQDLVAARGLSTASGADSTTATDLARIAWGKDYFTTARANPQQGSAVEVGFSAGTAPVTGLVIERTPASQTGMADVNADGTVGPTDNTNNPTPLSARRASSAAGADVDPMIEADLSQATGGIDINELRDAISLQRIAEAREFFGSRYVDYLRYYGVNPRDGRLDRPEYIGGGRQKLSISEVLSTADSGAATVGDLFGHGIAGVRSRRFKKMFEEHGWFIGVMSVRPKGVYQMGIPKRFLRDEPTDFWHRELELLPWQEVDELEIFGAGTPGNVFGYAPRYEEYRETMSYVSGTLRQGTEEDWTLAREFSAAPTLNSDFVTCTPSDRVYQDTNQPELVVTTTQQLMAKRLVSASPRMSSRAGI